MENIFKKSINIVLLSLLFFSSTIITTPENALEAIKLLATEKYKEQANFLWLGKSTTTEDNGKIKTWLNENNLNELIKKSLKILFESTTTETDILKNPAYYVLLIAIHHDCFDNIKTEAKNLLKDNHKGAFDDFFSTENQIINGRHILIKHQTSKYFSDLKLYFDAEKNLNVLENIAKPIKTFSTEDQTLFSKLSDGEFDKAKKKLNSLIQAFIWARFSFLKTQAETDKTQADKNKTKAETEEDKEESSKAKIEAETKISSFKKKIEDAKNFLEKTQKINLKVSGKGSIGELETKDGAFVVGLGVAAICTIIYVGHKIRLSILEIPFIKKHFDEKAKAQEKKKNKGSKKVTVSESKTPQ